MNFITATILTIILIFVNSGLISLACRDFRKGNYYSFGTAVTGTILVSFMLLSISYIQMFK